jgi:phosphohistidine phosphatase SixA
MSTGQVELYFLRHAHAGDPAAWQGDDDLRPLTNKGERQAERIGQLLASVGFRPDALVSSPLSRARRTAEIVGERLGVTVSIDERLGGDLGLRELESLLVDLGDPARPMVVGHDPAFSDLVSALCDTGGLLMRKGALARVDASRPLGEGAGSLRWLVPPDLLDPKR